MARLISADRPIAVNQNPVVALSKDIQPKVENNQRRIVPIAVLTPNRKNAFTVTSTKKFHELPRGSPKWTASQTSNISMPQKLSIQRKTEVITFCRLLMCPKALPASRPPQWWVIAKLRFRPYEYINK